MFLIHVSSCNASNIVLTPQYTIKDYQYKLMIFDTTIQYLQNTFWFTNKDELILLVSNEQDWLNEI